MKTRLLSLVLVLVMTTALLPASVFAAEAERNAILSDITNYSERIQQAVEDAHPEVREWVLANIGYANNGCNSTVDAFNDDVFFNLPPLDLNLSRYSSPYRGDNIWTFIEPYEGMVLESGDTLIQAGYEARGHYAVVVASYTNYCVVVESSALAATPYIWLSEVYLGSTDTGVGSGENKILGVLRPDFELSRANRQDNPSDYDLPNLETADEWARPGITEAVEKGFVPADLQNNYADKITREEFCRLATGWITVTLGKDLTAIVAEKTRPGRENGTFSDTSDPIIMAAYKLGVINGKVNPNGDTPGVFDPDGLIKRQEAALMLMNACRAVGADISNPPDSDFMDFTLAEDWAYNGIKFVRASKIMNGSVTLAGRFFNPHLTYTRQESIITFNNINHHELPKPMPEFYNILLDGGDLFTQNTQAALELIQEKSPSGWELVTSYIGCIQQGESSGMWAFLTPPTFVVGNATYTSSTTWYASSIVHDAHHSKQYHDHLAVHGSVPNEVWTGYDAEMQCLAVQIAFLEEIGAPQYEIDHAKSLIGSNWWDIDRWWTLPHFTPVPAA
ncbi:MAG: S-layer homology domain-containing protein [Oscillospiraceae bacterium]|nr:S-layer homology domain-containing protein [Oscillospiraceae bacterium]